MLTGTGMHRISVAEYSAPESVLEHAKRIDISADTLELLLNQVAQRISVALSVNEPIKISRGFFRIVDIAGLIKLAPNIELEVRPKFLGIGASSWREDFFAIATIARYGRVFPHEALRSGVTEKGDLADLLGRAVISMYDRNCRRPLRTYRRAVWQDFNVDGEVEPESLLLPEEDGFVQSGILLDRENTYNAVIHQAMVQLLVEVRDGDIRRQLYERKSRLSPQQTISHLPVRRQLPSRHRRWQELYELCLQILEGFGIGYADLARAVLPGYIIKTNDAWESFIFTAVRAGMKDRMIEKKAFALGTRLRPGSRDNVINTTPDIAIQGAEQSYFPVDAKYKGRISAEGKEILSIQPADLYEAMAFLAATAAKKAVLIYPLPSDSTLSNQTGRVAEFERASVGNLRVIGVTVDPRGISGSSGFRKFSEGLCSSLRQLGA
jgi:5-methylcytosine-specific restriction enzyme subunit McrC